MFNRFVTSVTAAALAALSLACQGPPNGTITGTIGATSTGNVRVRLVNALTSAQSLNFLVDGQVAATGVVFGAGSPYAPMSVGTHRLQAQATGTGTTLLDFTQDLETPGSFSLIPAPGLSSFGALFITDDVVPAAGQVKVRLVHVSAAAGPVALYITAPLADISSATPVVPVLVFGAASPYVAMPPGTYEVRITPVGNPSNVLVDLGTVVATARTVRTFLFTDSPGGGLPSRLSVLNDAP